MLKKIIAGILLSTAAFPVWAAEDVLKLPAPDTEGGKPLMEALWARRSTREFSAKKIDETDLSNILFAAWGISHEGKRTIPTSRNEQDLNVYAATENGVWLYKAENQSLEKVSDENIKPLLMQQEFVKDAPLTLVYVGKDAVKAGMNAAAAYQNVGLYCASRGLNNVVRGLIDKDKIAEVLQLDGQQVIVSQTIGWPYM